MLKHCSTSNKDLSQRSLRQSSLTVGSCLSVSTDLSDQFSSSQSSQLCSSQFSSEFVGLATLPRNQATVTTGREEEDTGKECLETLPLPTTIRVYATCLRPHLAYKTVMIKASTTSKQVISGLLKSFKVKHKDPKLFYLTMEVTVNQIFQTIKLGDNSLPAEMISCNPWCGCKFSLCSKPGVLAKIFSHNIWQDSVYKPIIISRDTTVTDTVSMLWSCYRSLQGQDLSLVECFPGHSERLLEGW